MHVLAMHGHADRDRRQHQHRDADVPVGDAEREHDDQDDEAHAADAARRVRSLTHRTVGPARVGRDASPESARKSMAEIEAHAPFWRPRRRALRSPAGLRPTMSPCPNGPRPRPPLTGRFAAAFALAWAVHGTQMRKKTGIPYMAHVMTVCALALENGADEDVAIAALLHDAVEDSEDGDATHEVIEEQFGERVAGSSWPAATPSRSRAAEARLARAQGDVPPPPRADADADVLLVSACDKVHNAGRSSPTCAPTATPCGSGSPSPIRTLQLWYYTSVSEILKRRLPGPLTDELGGPRRGIEHAGA